MLTSAQKTLYGGHTPLEGFEKAVNQKRGVLKCKYDFASQGGAVGTIALRDENGDLATLPDNAIITQVYVDILTAFTSTGNNGTIALTANSSGDLLAAVDADTLSGVSAGVPTGSAATMVKLTAARTITLAIATNAITAGAANFFVEWVLSD
jgi:hypothetical protein